MEAQNRALLTSANGKEPLKRKRQVMVTYNAAAAFKHRYIYLYSMFALADLPSPKWAPRPRGGSPVEGGRIHDEQVKGDETDLIRGCF